MDPNLVPIRFEPGGRSGLAPRGVTVAEAARLLGLDLVAPCGGQGKCGQCRVRLIPSDAPDPLSEGAVPAAGETDLLACQTPVQPGQVVFVPETSLAGKPATSKAPRPLASPLDPAVRSCHVTVPEPSLADPQADLERLIEALAAEHDLSGLTMDLAALKELGPALRAESGRITVRVFQDREIIRVLAGHRDPGFGLAIDLGTTTLAVYLCGLGSTRTVAAASGLNPQVRFGDDVMARTGYAAGRSEAAAELQAAVVDGLNRLIAEALAEAGAALGTPLAAQDIEDVVIAGNTTMTHLFLGLDPGPLGVIPFVPAFHEGLEIRARDVGLAVHPGARMFVMPCPAAYVGGDIVAGALAWNLHKADDRVLLIDIGTNGEIVLGNRDRLVSASSATGPAFEAAHIECGMRAEPGAIERVRIDSAARAVDYKVVSRPAWRSYSHPEAMGVRGICGSGVLDVLAELYTAGLIDKSGAFKKTSEPSASAVPPTGPVSPKSTGTGGSTEDSSWGGRVRTHPVTGIKEFVLAWSEETAMGRDVVVTQKDVRAIQLAKAALFTGTCLLLKRMGWTKPDRTLIAGSFGAHVDKHHALTMGLFPPMPIKNIFSVGNAAGDGCRLALWDRTQRREAQVLAGRLEPVELTLEPGFQERFLKALHLPDREEKPAPK